MDSPGMTETQPMKQIGRRVAVPPWFAILLIVAATLLAYANAWHGTLVYDDKFFIGLPHQPGLAEFGRYFTEDLWAASGMHSKLYRPVHLVLLALESRVYGDWYVGYHIDNILLHAAATLLVFGLLRRILGEPADGSPSQTLYALLAALVFAVHPVHTEVVNSIFNRSEILVALASAGGIWWLLHFLCSRPVVAWAGLALCYLLGLFSRESTVVLPGIAGITVLLLSPGPWSIRIRRCLPVFWLLLPLAVYLALRVHALSAADAALAGSPGGAALVPADHDWAGVPGFAALLHTFGVWGQALWLMIWPTPLLLSHEVPTDPEKWVWLLIQAVLVGSAILRYRAGYPNLLYGLAFFYIALLPATRFMGFTGPVFVLTERSLYTPSIGLALALATGLQHLGQKSRPAFAVVAVFLALLVLTPLTRERNGEWASDLALFESDYRRSEVNSQTLRLLTAANLEAGNFDRVAEICDTHDLAQPRRSRYANNCAIAYMALGRKNDAGRAFERAAKSESAAPVMIANLARFYLGEGRRDEAMTQYQRAVDAEVEPGHRAFRRGEMLVLLYPRDRDRLIEARAHFAEAVRLQPQLAEAQVWLNRLDRALATD